MSLSEVLRPTKLSEIVGQHHLLGPGKPLQQLIIADKICNMILYGPPGTGKTTIAEVIANLTKAKFLKLNATSVSVAQIRKNLNQDVRIVIFIDELYRMNKNNQDVLLPYIEKKDITLIAATTENPYHALRGALVSRCQIFEFEPLSDEDLVHLLYRASKYYKKIEVTTGAIKHIIRLVSGDGRKAINILEVAVNCLVNTTVVDIEHIQCVAPNRYMVFGKDLHYDYASWMQGAIQASDPDSAVYALAAWLESGEDPRYIARRLMVSASEDASSTPSAAIIAHSAYVAACTIGRPECDIILSHAVVSIASAPRDKSAAKAIWAAVADIKKGSDLSVPKSMRDSHYTGAKKLGNGSYKDGMNQSEYIGVNKKYFFKEIL